jgi:hypothetical protein
MSTTTTPSFASFAPGECHQPLPLNPIVDTFRFSKFIGIVRDVDGNATKVVLPRSGLLKSYSRVLAGHDATATVIDLEGGIALGDDPDSAEIKQPLARRVVVDSVEELVANPTLTVDGTAYSLNLDAAAIRKLLSAEPAAVEAVSVETGKATKKAGSPRILLRVHPKAPPTRPASLDVEITDLAAFLTRPHIRGVDGGTVQVPLTSELIGGLRRHGRAEVRVGDAAVTLKVSSDPAGFGSPAYEVSRQAATVAPAPPITSSGPGQPPPGQPSTSLETRVGQTSPPTFELALHVQWIQEWRLKGYSRGVLLNTIALAPQEETTLEIFTWDRRKTQVERTSSVESDESLERSDTVRDTTDVMRQAQSSSEFAFHADGTVGVNIYDVVKIGVTVGASEKDTFANLSKTSTNFIHENVSKSASRVKQSRQTKVSESMESGREERVTRKIRNPNMCHALNLDYFEELANYEVVTRFSAPDAGLVLLVENPLKDKFDRWALRVFETPLSRVLMDRDLAPGFAAARLLDSRDRACPVLCRRCHCLGGSGSPSPDAVAALQAQLSLLAAMTAAFETGSVYIDQWFEILEKSDYYAMRMQVFLDTTRWWVYGELLRLGAPQVYAALRSLFQSRQSNTAPTIDQADALRQALDDLGGIPGIQPKKLFAENKGQLERAIGNQYSVYRLTSKEPTMDPYLIPFVYASGLLDTFNDRGLVPALSRFLALYDGAVAAQKATTAAQALEAEEEKSASEALLSAFGLREVSDGLEREAALLDHLNLHGDYYRAMLWNALNPSTQLGFLQPLLPAEVVEPHAVGFIGRRIAFPIRIDAVPGAKKLLDDLVATNQGLDNLTRNELVTMPTPAVTLEARLGACDACEDFLRDHRKLDLAQKETEIELAKQRVEQEKLETERYQARLNLTPPNLDDPDPNQGSSRLSISIKQEDAK